MKWQAAIVGACVSLAGVVDGTALGADLVKTIDGVTYTLIDYTYLGIPGRLYVPPGYNSSQATPVVTFLAGLGEKGTDNSNQINWNMYNLLKRARTENFILFAPQSSGGWWSELDWVVRNVGQIATQYNVDSSRLYMTGLSAGGSGTMYGIRNYSDLFAGYVPLSIAGGGFTSAADAAPGVGKSIWFYAGAGSGGGEASFATASRNSVTYILQGEGVSPLPSMPAGVGYEYFSPNGKIRYTQVAGASHDNGVWNNGAYNDSRMYSWLLSQSNPVAAPALGKTVRLSLGSTSSTDPSGKVDGNGNFWNVANGYLVQQKLGVAQPFAQDQDGARTTMNVSVSESFYSNATVALPPGAPYDASIAGSYWGIYVYQQSSAQLTINGLTPHGEYNLGLFASLITTDMNNYIGLYSVGDQSIVINAANNTAEYMLFGLVADATGRMVLDVNLSGTSQRAILNSLSLTAVPEPGAVVGALGLIGVLLRRRRG